MKKGFTLVEIMIVVAIIGIIIAIAVPAFLRARENSRGRACQENLSKIDGAKEQYAIENKIGNGSPIDMSSLALASGTGYLKETPVCPADGDQYTVSNVGTAPSCPNYNASSPYVKHELPTSGGTAAASS